MLFITTEWWNSLTTTEQIFWGIAIIFSVLFLIQFVISLFGMDFDSDVDVDLDAGADLDGGSDYSLDPSFTLLSVRSIIAFFTFFGWAGVLALSRGHSSTSVIIIAFVSGLAAMILVAYLMYFFSSLSETGTMNVQDLVFKNARVYLTVPGRRKGLGNVHVSINNSLHEMDALTEGEELPNGQTVKIVEVLKDNVLVVESLDIFESQPIHSN